MRCNRRLFVKLRRFLVLTTVLTSLIIVITVVNRRPGILRSVQYSDLVNFKYTNGQRPGAFLADYKLNNESYCNFKYDLPLRFKYDETDLEYSPELQTKSPYRVLYNVLEAQQFSNSWNRNSNGAGINKNSNNNDKKNFQQQHRVIVGDSLFGDLDDAVNVAAGLGYNYTSNGSPPLPVTYATHVTPEFINYISEIARVWDGAVSVAAFVPDDDADFITRRLLHVCQCMPEMAKVSVHYVFPVAHPPYVKANVNGDILAASSATGTCEIAETADIVTYRTVKQLPYPVNLARNVARKAANTEYILVSDIELMPSDHLAGRFNKMMRRYARMKRLNYPSRVFVVPVFEIEKYEEIPRTKQQLLKLVRDEKALYFHRHICSHCQKFPGLENWLQQDSHNDDIKPLTVVKREYPFHRWEPIFIGTKDEPFYSEMLSWEGMQDKMTQMLEMCLKGYRFVILDNAFLIHWPGVKRKSNELKMRNKWRYPYLMKNTRQYNNIINNLANKYRRNPKCKVQ